MKTIVMQFRSVRCKLTMPVGNLTMPRRGPRQYLTTQCAINALHPQVRSIVNLHRTLLRSIESIGRWKKMARRSCDKKVPLARAGGRRASGTRARRPGGARGGNARTCRRWYYAQKSTLSLRATAYTRAWRVARRRVGGGCASALRADGHCQAPPATRYRFKTVSCSGR